MDERTNCVVSDCTAVKMMKLPFILLFVLIVFIDYVLGYSSFYESRLSCRVLLLHFNPGGVWLIVQLMKLMQSGTNSQSLSHSFNSFPERWVLNNNK